MNVTVDVDEVAKIIDEAIERRFKDLRDRLALVEMNVREVRQKTLPKPRVRVLPERDGRPVVRLVSGA
jgi:hypothetical protein